MVSGALKRAPEILKRVPEIISVFKFTPVKAFSKSARRGARCPKLLCRRHVEKKNMGERESLEIAKR